MHPELNSTLERRDALIEKMNNSAAFDPKLYRELGDLQRRIALMEQEGGSDPDPTALPAADPDQPSLDLQLTTRPRRAAKT